MRRNSFSHYDDVHAIEKRTTVEQSSFGDFSSTDHHKPERAASAPVWKKCMKLIRSFVVFCWIFVKDIQWKAVVRHMFLAMHPRNWTRRNMLNCLQKVGHLFRFILRRTHVLILRIRYKSLYFAFLVVTVLYVTRYSWRYCLMYTQRDPISFRQLPYPTSPFSQILLQDIQAEKDRYECIGWEETEGCSPFALVDRTKFKRCDQNVSGGHSGYCRIRNKVTKKDHAVMVSTCNSIMPDQSLSCDMAIDFAFFKHKSLAFKPAEPVKFRRSRGIIIGVYDKILADTYAAVRVLRSLGCKLPIELWHRSEEITMTREVVSEILKYNVKFHQIVDPEVKGYYVKPYAVFHTDFEEVILLDADNIPVKDPTFLFETKEYIEKGAIFWPDFWHPAHSPFEVTHASLLWEYTGIKYVNMFEQESGQVVINRKRHTKALQVLIFYASYEPNLFRNLRIVWGDKDLFRLAWMRAESPFHMIERPPGSAGWYNSSGIFCGLTMVQHDAKGEILFYHRNTAKHIVNQTTVLDYVQEYMPKDDPFSFWMKGHRGSGFEGQEVCHGVWDFKKENELKGRKMYDVFPVPRFVKKLEKTYLEHKLKYTEPPTDPPTETSVDYSTRKKSKK